MLHRFKPLQHGSINLARLANRAAHVRSRAPFAVGTWRPIPVVASDRYAYELERTYTEQYHDEVPHHRVQEWKTRRNAKLSGITIDGVTHVPLSRIYGATGRYTVPAHT